MNNKPQYSGIENQFPLLGGDPNCNYRFGIFKEGTHDYFFRLSFNTRSELAASGIEPELIIVVDRENSDKSIGGRFIEEQRYNLVGRRLDDEDKSNWFFLLTQSQMQELADSDCIKTILIEKNHKTILDLGTTIQDIWSLFFRAGVAECVNEEQDTWELMRFCALYDSIKRMKKIEAAIVASGIKASALIPTAIDPNGSLDNY